MQITPRAALLAAALFASTQVLAADAGSPMTDTSTQHATTKPDDCWPASADFSTGLARLLPRAGNTTPDSADHDRDLGKAVSCMRPLGLQKNEPGNGASLTQDYFLTATTADTSMAWPRQRSFLESSPGPDAL